MAKLGSYPVKRYSRAWITQRLVNRLPEWSQVRQSASSIGQQFLNPIGLDIQDTVQQLARERANMFLSTVDLNTVDQLFNVVLSNGMEFEYDETSSGERIYSPPSVFAMINDVEYEITQAEENNVRTLAYENIPSRIENGETNHSYEAVIEEITISNLSTAVPNDIAIPGHLYITLKENTSWEVRTSTKIYYPKVYITGLTRKGTEITEAVPMRYNGTFKTVNEWQEVSSVSVSYLDSTATLAVESFSYSRESYLDTNNIYVPVSGGERLQFTRLGTHLWGSSFLAESFTLSDMDDIRNVQIDEKEINHEMELLDVNDNNVELIDFVHRPNSKYIYGVDNDNLYVYNVDLPYPESKRVVDESPETRMDLYSDKWILVRDETATIKTRIINDLEPPYKVRWHILDPDGEEYYMGLDGSLWSISTEGWIDNERWPDGLWQEQEIDFVLTKAGSYVITLESFYSENDETFTLYTKFLFFVPSIVAEAQFSLPSELTTPTNIGFDSDGKLWILRYDGIHKIDLFYDYFLVDYERQTVWLKEEYPSVKVVL